MPMKLRIWNSVIGHHVAQRAGRLVEIAAILDTHRLGHGDLHIVDMVAVPQRLEDAVGEAEDHDVLDRLLAQIMVDPVDLLLVQHRQQLGVERLRRGEVVAERLLDDDAAPDALRLGAQPHAFELNDDLGEIIGRGGRDRTGCCRTSRRPRRACSPPDGPSAGDRRRDRRNCRARSSCGRRGRSRPSRRARPWRIGGCPASGHRGKPRPTGRRAPRPPAGIPPAAACWPRDYRVPDQQPARQVARRAEDDHGAGLRLPSAAPGACRHDASSFAVPRPAANVRSACSARS